MSFLIWAPLVFIAAALIVYLAGSSRSRFGDGLAGFFEKNYSWLLWIHPRMMKSLFIMTLALPLVFVLIVLMGGGVFYGLLTSLSAAAIGLFVLAKKEKRLKEQFEDQLIMYLPSLANGIKAGLGLPQALEGLMKEAPEPLYSVISSAISAYKLRRTLAEAMFDVQRKTQSKNFGLVVEALVICEERGGPLPQILIRIAAGLSELRRLREKIRTSTSGPRLSIRVMLVTPIFMLLVLWGADPQSIEILFNTAFGWAILSIVIALVFVAVCWARSILNQYV